MTQNSHSIQKVFLEIDTSSMVMANSIKNSLAMFLQNEIFPLLEKYFNSIKNIENQIIQIEKLEILIDSDTEKKDILFSNSETKNDIKKQIEREIQKFINDAEKNSKNGQKNELEWKSISSKDKQIKTLLYFIENGSMPWWISKEEEIIFFKELNFNSLQNENFSALFRKLIHQEKVQKRIINQFSNQEIALLSTTFLKSETQQKPISTNRLLPLLNQKTHRFKVLFWQSVFDFWIEKKPIHLIKFYHQEQALFLSKEISFNLFFENIKLLVPLDFTNEEIIQMKTDYLTSEKEKTIAKSDSDSKKDKPEPKSILINEEVIIEDNHQDDDNGSKSCYVQNAGLIILHPFFKEMLKSCDLMDDNNTLLNKELAAHILHYAATKKENDYEHSMLFEKFLCGIPLHESIQRKIKIEDKHKKQVEEMLDSVVLHWSALKNTSTAVLRSEFLQREGKLDLSESNPKLFIERKTQDLLLEKIPWNISIVKIPWIQKLIYTQW
ncbi:contractile injection system tape measure protein [Flavobacterium gyeonganense]|uniref:Contractile injection system tape measure protein n=1 Tax=Flavobacterium gyeonganense TaxID=1310418 RepID=A0ABV5HBY3_9FLAO|nr:contractile injection system tape measure protein [Flavobacterium gyeonganense]